MIEILVKKKKKRSCFIFNKGCVWRACVHMSVGVCGVQKMALDP